MATLIRICNFLLVGMVVTLAGCKGENSINKAEAINTADKVESDSLATSNTNIQELRKITSIAGSPKNVWWVYEAMGSGSSGARSIPGPTDYLLHAIIDYGSAEAVAELVVDKTGRALQSRGAQWYPDFLTPYIDDEGTIQTQRFNKVEGFHPEAAMRVLDKLPSHVILIWVSG